MTDSELSNLEWAVCQSACRLIDSGGVVDSEWDAESSRLYEEFETATKALIAAREAKEKEVMPSEGLST